MNTLSKISGLVIAVLLLAASTSCKKEYSGATGWKYNDEKNGGVEKTPYVEQETGPGLVFIEGGTFVMGQVEQDVMYDWNTNPRRVTISSFYMDDIEVTNQYWRDYLAWLERVYVVNDLRVVYDNAYPDENVWRLPLNYSDREVSYYFKHPAYNDYPVVGVSWLQCVNYAAWRSDRVNEQILKDHGLIEFAPDASPEDYFSTDAYLTYDYAYNSDKQVYNITTQDYRQAKMEDGILLPKYRLPTEAEWEYAAYGLIGNTVGERVLERKVYPWNGHFFRMDDNKYQGEFVANVRRGRGDYMGTAGHLNDGSPGPAPSVSYWPNDYGLWNMGGNVAEWVMDVYRQTSNDDVVELNPFRGNYYETKKLLEDGTVAERDSIGNIPMVPVSDFKNDRRRNYRQADNKNFLDGDWASLIESDAWMGTTPAESTDLMYRKNNTNYSLVGDHARVYKGGSWKDIQYWAAPGHRRYLDEDEATDYIGFRCAMDRVGSQVQGK
ncbi:MAG: SUMF1/EgtB/PvdO family nonheme iron enzyme [Bacteroidales bacterium]|jgi:gliding motility-associated lipoprotein GldJ|nr:SUMF1/EgtB/PvdO family nonheme iron enzyme [Bacteroidales bacterium]